MRPERNGPYRPTDKEAFMNERQRDYFRKKLLAWREDILREAKGTLAHLQDENQNHPDLADRASSETDRAIELRAGGSSLRQIARVLRDEGYATKQGVAMLDNRFKRNRLHKPMTTQATDN